MARLLGLDPRRGVKETFSGTSGKAQTAHYHRLTVRVNRFSYRTVVGFARLPPDLTGLLGQNGFFDRFEVLLSQPAELILLRFLRA